jgi:hypothetical protein
MATIFANGWDIPNEHIAIMGRAHNVVQGKGDGVEPDETQQEALTRLEDKIIANEMNRVKRQYKQELGASGETYVSKN